MLKLSLFIIAMLLVSGCAEKSPSHKMAHSKQMFQTVKAEEATLVQEGEHKNSCLRCGMNLTKFYKTSHAAVHDGEPQQYCSIHCLAEHLDEGVELKNPVVVDVSSLKMIPVHDAYYVVGSSKRGTMSRVSKYAFASLEDAQKFQNEFGGKIVDFQAALDIAREDFK